MRGVVAARSALAALIVVQLAASSVVIATHEAPRPRRASTVMGERFNSYRDRTILNRPLRVENSIRPRLSRPSAVESPTLTPTPYPSGILERARELIPSTIAKDCSVDVTAALLDWVASRPDGSILRLAKDGCYRAEGSLKIVGRKNLTIEGNGATIKSFAKGPLNSQGHSERRHVWFVGSKGITVRDLRVEGTNTVADQRAGFGSYLAKYEFEHAFAVHECEDVLLENLSADAIWGDGLYIGNQGASRNVTVKNFTVDRNGRQGVAVSHADGVLLDNINILHSRRAGFDLEPPPGTVRNVEIRNSYTNSIGLGFASAGWNDVSNIYIHHNRIDGPSVPWVYVKASNGARRSNWRIYDNVVLKTLGSPSPAMYFVRVDGVDIRRNVSKVASSQSRRSVLFVEAGGILKVIDNDFTGACSDYEKRDTTVPVEAHGNAFSTCS